MSQQTSDSSEAWTWRNLAVPKAALIADADEA